jgi:hypothetical protein
MMITRSVSAAAGNRRERLNVMDRRILLKNPFA